GPTRTRRVRKPRSPMKRPRSSAGARCMSSRSRLATKARAMALERERTERLGELLRRAARPPAPADVGGIGDLGPAWSRVTSHAIEHGLRPALIELLSSVDWKAVPDPMREELEEFQRWHLLRT